MQLAYKEFQQFQSADIITTQFKSNYSSNVASVLKEDGTIVNIPMSIPGITSCTNLAATYDGFKEETSAVVVAAFFTV